MAYSRKRVMRRGGTRQVVISSVENTKEKLREGGRGGEEVEEKPF